MMRVIYLIVRFLLYLTTGVLGICLLNRFEKPAYRVMILLGAEALVIWNGPAAKKLLSVLVVAVPVVLVLYLVGLLLSKPIIAIIQKLKY